MSEPRGQEAPTARLVVIQLAILLVLAVALFARELWRIAQLATLDTEAAHALAAPVLALILVWRRRQLLRDKLSRGSVWGFGLVILGILMVFLATWPFNHGLPRRLAIIVVLTGSVLSLCGWRVLKHCVPMLLLLLIAVPVGPRMSAALTRPIGHYTVKATIVTLELMPGVAAVDLEGPDLHYVTTDGRGTIALGEPNRAATLLLACLSVVVFVAFFRIRPLWQLIVLAIGSVPILLFCNYARLMIWGLASVYGGAGPISSVPRVSATVATLLLAYVLVGLLVLVITRLFEPART